MKVKIEKIGINGEGIAYINKQPVFIDGVLPDEIVDIEIIKHFPRYKIGKMKQIVKNSTERVIPKCSVWKECQACTLMHADYDKQLLYKRMILSESLQKYAGISESKVHGVIKNENVFGYRNSLKLPFHMHNKKLVLGMYAKESNRFVQVKNCIVHEEQLETIKMNILKILNKYHYEAFSNQHKNGLRYLVLRGIHGVFQCTIVSGNTIFLKECIDEIMEIDGLVSLWQSINMSKKSVQLFGNQMMLLAGKKKIKFKFKGLTISLSPKAFFQLNTGQAERLYDLVEEFISDTPKLIVEAYCGVGIMSLMLAKKAEKVIGIEVISDAIANARRNADMNKINNVEFYCGDAGKELVKISKKQAIDVLVVDPPRSGLDETMITCILKSNIKKIIYVSCNPATLGKNIKTLSKKYEVEEVIPVDMFSNTAHVESVALLTKSK
ncbi:23S rRNA (uracil1939-C5)-methyltransferase [Breznakia sp. PF5-3]|uniref:23S rRNA (uracil(1939)-C(5))-methyltransferase RlmD n=1 Tax=unclassified Breznakia TaxID=2623764 RepID=UPI0024058E08|nr:MULTISPECIES: 23S rRNA (uracil(1939)-C(5))-methyltransferase RlmD [unclassified Breznakia]MDF9824013.1 23S rRNA (uracil1939-C5)-methyltransferase [Breznakia sp. PM6-1]MDF9834812.1 23S rRNA (uracil1939-C5)-methyltransferase [Breznakia sp. PF5-3]MDF9838131.1 23S rRNA (uracil1939-C5)-methyltransferase [Breznakia sp. PFB2-8]MDF9860117.1 23S rRNA (uracil1939-C5)-methyltransferase [Breznakia sp. PH5-24]